MLEAALKGDLDDLEVEDTDLSSDANLAHAPEGGGPDTELRAQASQLRATMGQLGSPERPSSSPINPPEDLDTRSRLHDPDLTVPSTATDIHLQKFLSAEQDATSEITSDLGLKDTSLLGTAPSIDSSEQEGNNLERILEAVDSDISLSSQEFEDSMI